MPALSLAHLARAFLPLPLAAAPSSLARWRSSLRRRKTVATAGRSYGGPSEKFVGDFRSCPLTSQKLPLCGDRQTKRILGQLLRSLLQNRQNFSEVAPEVRPAVHTAPLCLILNFLLFPLALLIFCLLPRLLLSLWTGVDPLVWVPLLAGVHAGSPVAALPELLAQIVTPQQNARANCRSPRFQTAKRQYSHNPPKLLQLCRDPAFLHSLEVSY